MLGSTSQYLPYLTSIVFVVGMVCLSHTVRERLLYWRSSKQAGRIAAVLYIELAALRELYQRNLDLVAQGAPRLLSGRSAAGVSRGDMRAMLNYFSEPLLTRIVTTFTLVDRIEAEVAAMTKPYGALAYHMKPGPHLPERLRRQYIRGCEHLDATLSALAQEWPMAAAASQRPIADTPPSQELAAAHG